MVQTPDYSSEPDGQIQEPSRHAYRALLVAMAALGVLIVGVLPPLSQGDDETRVWADFGLMRWASLGVIVATLLLPPVRSRLAPLLERLRLVSPAARPRIAIAIAILAGTYLLCTAWGQDRDFFPKTHDEQSYLLQMRMLAAGRLWMPAHELADFFETFHVTVEPVYASVYFPGTAMMYVPGLLLGWPVWLLPLMVSAACVGLLYALVTDLVDGLAGLLAAVLLLSLSWFRMLSIMLMGQIPAMLLGLLMFWAWLRWRETRAAAVATGPSSKWREGGWVVMIGACAGWMAITRPVDALCYAIPVGIGMLFDLYKRRSTAPTWISSLALLAAAAAPFLTVQLVFNKGVTGSYLETPFVNYINRFQPQTSFGFHNFDPTIRPDTLLPQKQALYDLFVVPRAKNHTPAKLAGNWARKYARFTLDVTTPARPLIILLPIGLLAVRGVRHWVLVCTAALFVGLYALYTFYLEHYIVVIAPAAILLAVLSMKALERAWPIARGAIACLVSGAILFCCLSTLPETHPRVTDETFPSPMLRVLHNLQLDHQAVMLVRWVPGKTPTRNYHQEPVYNTQAAWPDDNDIIYAHDLAGDHPVRSREWWRANRRIFDYYARHQPNRQFILFDRGLVDAKSGEPTEPLGSAAQLAQQARAVAGQ